MRVVVQGRRGHAQTNCYCVGAGVASGFVAGALTLLLLLWEGNQSRLVGESEMFGREKTSSAVKQKRRWFFKVENIIDAEEAIKIGYQAFYALAAIQAVIPFALYLNVSVANFFGPILMLVLAWFIHPEKSSTAAVMLGVYTVFIALSTFGNRIGIDIIGGFGGKNIVLAALALYGIYKGLQGTFKYHRLVGNKVIGKNVWKMAGILLLYYVLVFGILILISDSFSDDTLGFVGLLCIFLVSAGTAFRILPWTKNKPLIARTSSSTGSDEPS